MSRIPDNIDLAQYFDEDPKPLRIERDGALDYESTGWFVGGGELGDRRSRSEWVRWTAVDLWVTVTRKYIVQIRRTDEGTDVRLYNAHAADTFDEIVRWLMDDNHGRLGPASKAMVEDVSDMCEWLKDHETVKI
jgi:hypothetical protein